PLFDSDDPQQREVMERMQAHLKALQAREEGGGKQVQTIERIPYFCSGCPHNSSTKVPEGSRAHAGIGCHYMAMWMDRSTTTFSQMGGEGMTWVGQAPFSTTEHVFQNLGDGTFFHSGSLAIRHALASRTRITFKILFNDAVAMTGGQRHDGLLSPQMIAQLVRAEGVERIEVVSDEPEKYPVGYFPAGVSTHHRRDLDAVQRGLRDFDGVSVLIYDQTCAAEKRRRRKRGAFPDPQRRVFINDAVCEGCGDCGVQANCVSIEPLETEMGRKRRINQSSCNKDFSCVEGFCPSFVSVEGAKPRRGKASKVADDALNFSLPEVQLPGLEKPYALLVTGIGGTGVVTIGALLGMAAHLEAKAVTVLDMAGLAQKNGAVMSFVRFADQIDELHAPRIGLAAADAVLGCDVVVTSGKDALSKLRSGTRVVANVAAIPTADFTRNADWKFPLGSMESAILDVVGEGQADFVDATRLAEALLGDSIAANLFLLGYAWQKGMIPVSAQAIDRAIELNDTAVEQNRQAFLWGRRAAVDLYAVTALALQARSGSSAVPQSRAIASTRSKGEALASQTSFSGLLKHRKQHLLAYQDQGLVDRYEQLVERALKVEAAVRDRAKLSAASDPDSADSIDTRPLATAVARYFAKLLAYKDEYEVARLYADPAFAVKLQDHFEGPMRLRFHLAPPLLSKMDANGHLIKSDYGPWMMKAFGLLQHLKFLRGTALDPFGYSEERKKERAWIAQYEAGLRRALERLEETLAPPQARVRLAEAYQALVVLAQIPEHIRGFGHVKERHFKDAQARWKQSVERFDQAFAEDPPQDPNNTSIASNHQVKEQVVELHRHRESVGTRAG
ncbi:MAG: indolepyruvate ferredoxin oxidoreductase family protein, partial [Betaproteobacteria bacterium]|nr:indolepyruvate ferredoxin oxidoreductase family protein [Betaproteobacteria bacterium]